LAIHTDGTQPVLIILNTQLINNLNPIDISLAPRWEKLLRKFNYAKMKLPTTFIIYNWTFTKKYFITKARFAILPGPW